MRLLAGTVCTVAGQNLEAEGTAKRLNVPPDGFGRELWSFPGYRLPGSQLRQPLLQFDYILERRGRSFDLGIRFEPICPEEQRETPPIAVAPTIKLNAFEETFRVPDFARGRCRRNERSRVMVCRLHLNASGDANQSNENEC